MKQKHFLIGAFLLLTAVFITGTKIYLEKPIQTSSKAEKAVSTMPQKFGPVMGQNLYNNKINLVTSYTPGDSLIICSGTTLADSTTGCPSSSVPSVPQNVAAIGISTSAITVSYTAPASGSPASYIYTTQYSTSSGGTYTNVSGCVGLASLSCTVNGLAVNTTYYFKVAATNATGAGSYSTAVSGTTYNNVPSAPTLTAGTVSYNSIPLTWTSSSATPAPTYTVNYGTTSGSLSAVYICTNVIGTGCIVPNLSASTTYYFTVTATNSNGSATSSQISVATSANTGTAPTAATALTVGTVTASSVGLTWTAPSTGTPTPTYLVQYTTNDQLSQYSLPNYAICFAQTATSCTLNNLTQGIQYYFDVVTNNTAGTAVSTQATATTTPASVAPSAPTSVTATASTTVIPISWVAPTPIVSPTPTYTVRYGTNSGNLTAYASCTGIVSTNCLILNASPNTTYYFTVTASNTYGSATSSQGSITTSNTSSSLYIPGPNADLYNTPYYTCTTNYYVSPTGSDTTGNGTSGNPWATFAHAQSAGITSGTGAQCVNAAAGTYASGIDITKGGSTASSTGYVVYRCQTLDGCLVTDAGNQNDAAFDVQANYVIIDGFVMNASSATLYGQGVEVFNGTNNFTFSQHHVWVINNVITGYGQSGMQLNDGEYLYAVHNLIFGNAVAGCSAQGSGISSLQPIAASGYTPTSDDTNNIMVGPIGSNYHIGIEWNVLYNNSITQCGSFNNPYDTDGNNIIFDTWSWLTNCNPAQPITGSTPYVGGGLIAFNIAYNGGMAGIATDCAVNVTIANNTLYNNDLDIYDSGSDRGGIRIENQGSSANSASFNDTTTIVNNIALSIESKPSIGLTSGQCQYNTVPYTQFNVPIQSSPGSSQTNADVYGNNVTEALVYASCYSGNDFNGYGIDSTSGSNNSITGPYTCTANKCGTSPSWVNVSAPALSGTQSNPPLATNFALQSGSPAIGYGATESYLPSVSVDAGACPHTLTQCP